MSEIKRGICPECKVKEDDSSRKALYKCRLCERWFCAKHFEPRLAYIRDLKAVAKYPDVRVSFEKEWRREDGHPDFAYSLKRFRELDMEAELHSKLIEEALNRSKAYRKKTPKRETTPEKPIARLTPVQEPSQVSAPVRAKLVSCPKCSSERTMITAVREEFDVFECLECHHNWKHLGGVPDRDLKKKTKRKTRIRILTREIKNLLASYFFGAVLAIVGLGIVYWQVYSPALTFLLFFYVIPIPLILIGIVLFAIGFLVVVGILVSMIRKHSISIKLVAVPLVFSLVIFSCFGIIVFGTMHRTFYVGTSFVNTDYIRAQVFDLINEERVSRSLPELSFDQKLTDVAQVWSEDLAERRYLEHGNFEARMSSIGYESHQCGEIIAEIPLGGIGFFQTRVEQEFVNGWLESSGHREIMLTPFTGYLGVGCSKNSDSIYCVADLRFD